MLSKGRQVCAFPSACQRPHLPLSPSLARTTSADAEMAATDTSVASELTEAELLELAAVDEAMELTAKEQERLDRVRQDCGQLGRADDLSPMASAQRHAFKLVNHNGERRVACLACKGEEPAAAGAERYFLHNFCSRHIKGSAHAVAVGGAPAAAAAAATAAAAASAAAALEANLATPLPSLPPALLESLSLADDATLSLEQRETAERLRHDIHTDERLVPRGQALEYGCSRAALHAFRLLRVDGACVVECACCGSRSSAGDDAHFLNNFRHRHLGSAVHAAAAEARWASIHLALHDAAAHGAGEAQTAAAGAVAQPTRAAELAEEAAAAAERARAAAERAALSAGVLLLPSTLFGRQEPQPLVATELEHLIGCTPAVEWLVDDEGARLGWRCKWCNRAVTGTEKEQVKKLRDHLGSNDHRMRRSYGGRTMLTFFGAQQEGPAPAPCAPPDLRTLCYGYYKSTLSLRRANGMKYAADVRFVLERTPGTYAIWRPDPYCTGEIRLAGTEAPISISGTIRSKACRRFSVSPEGIPEPDGMCAACRGLAKEHAFKEFVRKHHLALEQPCVASKTRYDLLGSARRLEIMRGLAAHVRLLRQQLFTLHLKYQLKCRRVRSLKERLEELSVRGDAKVLIENIIACEKSGKFKQRATLYNFISDMVRSLKNRTDERGAHSRANRWHESSKRVFGALQEMGGPKVLRFLHETLEAPADSTVRAHLRQSKINYEPGVKRSHFAAVGEVRLAGLSPLPLPLAPPALHCGCLSPRIHPGCLAAWQLYAKIKAEKGITEDVGYELQKDESAVPGGSQYNQRLDAIVGYCGTKGDGHQCDDECCIVIGDGDDAYQIIRDAHETQQLAGYLALIVVVPLDERLPCIALVAHATCNRFTARWQRDQWERVEKLADELISPKLGWHEAHGSDGDERRAKLMKEDMCILPSLPNRFGLSEPSFTMSGRRDAVTKKLDKMHAMDGRHNVGKMYTHTDSSVRYLEFGNARVTHEHVRAAWEIFEASELDLPWTVVQRQDRMDKSGPARCAGQKVRHCLSLLVAGNAGTARLKPGQSITRPEPTMQGTIDYLDMMSRYIRMIFSKTASFEERVEHAAYVVGLLRRWRQFVKHGKHVLSVKENFLPRQTYQHVLLSCFSIVLKIIAHAERGSQYTLALWLSGSNACEDAFSALGGFGRLIVMVRNFTFGGALESLGHQAVIEAYKVTGEDPLRFGKHRGHKADIDMRHHEDVDAEPADLSGQGHPRDYMAAYNAAWRRGDEAAAATAERRGMKPAAGARGRLPDWWERPWEGDADVSDLREADADEMGDEVLGQTVDATGEPLGVPVDAAPDLEHPAIAAHLVATEEEEALPRRGESEEEAEEPPPGEGAGEEVDLSGVVVPEPPPPPRIHRPPPPRPPREEAGEEQEDEEEGSGAGVRLDVRTAAELEQLIDRARDEQQAQEAVNRGQPQATPSKVKPTVSLPAELGGGEVYKRSLVAEHNRMRPGELLPIGRLQKMKAARLMVEAPPKPARSGAAESEAVEEEEEDERLARGVDFGMAFKEGTGQKGKLVCWLGRVEKLFRPGERRSSGVSMGPVPTPSPSDSDVASSKTRWQGWKEQGARRIAHS